MTKHSFTNFEYNVMSGPTSQTVNVVVSYLFDNKKARYVVILNQKKGANYIEEAKKVIKNKIDDGSLAKFSTKLMRRSKKPLLLGVVAAVVIVAFISCPLLIMYKYLNPGSGGGGGGGGEPQQGDYVPTNFDIGSSYEGMAVTAAKSPIIGEDYDTTIYLNETATPANASQYILPEKLDKVTYKKSGTETEITEYTYEVNKKDDSNSAHLKIDKKYVLGPINVKLTLAATTPVVVTIGSYDTNAIELKNGSETLSPGDTIVVKNKSLSLDASTKTGSEPGYGYRLDHDSFSFVDESKKPMQGVTWSYTFDSTEPSPLTVNNLKENCTLNVTAIETVTITPGAIDPYLYKMEYKGEPFDKPITVDKGTDVGFDCTVLNKQYELTEQSFNFNGQAMTVGSYDYTPVGSIGSGDGILTLFKIDRPLTIGIYDTKIIKITINAIRCEFPEEAALVNYDRSLNLKPIGIDPNCELTNDCFEFSDPRVAHSYDGEQLVAYNFIEDCSLTIKARVIPVSNPTLTVSENSKEIITILDSGDPAPDQTIDLTDYIGRDEVSFDFKYNDSTDYTLAIESPSNEGIMTITPGKGGLMSATIAFDETPWPGHNIVISAIPTVVDVEIVADQVSSDITGLYYYEPDDNKYYEITDLSSSIPINVAGLDWGDGYIGLAIVTSPGRMITENDLTITGVYGSVEIESGYLSSYGLDCWYVNIKNVLSSTLKFESIITSSSLVQISTKLESDYSASGITITGPVDETEVLTATPKDITYDISYGSIAFYVETEEKFSIDSLCVLTYTDENDDTYTVYGEYRIIEYKNGTIRLIEFNDENIFNATSITLSITPHAYESAFTNTPAKINLVSGGGKASARATIDGNRLELDDTPLDIYRGELLLYIDMSNEMHLEVYINEEDVTEEVVMPITLDGFNYNVSIETPNISPGDSIYIVISRPE